MSLALVPYVSPVDFMKQEIKNRRHHYQSDADNSDTDEECLAIQALFETTPPSQQQQKPIKPVKHFTNPLDYLAQFPKQHFNRKLDNWVPWKGYPKKIVKQVRTTSSAPLKIEGKSEKPEKELERSPSPGIPTTYTNNQSNNNQLPDWYKKQMQTKWEQSKLQPTNEIKTETKHYTQSSYTGFGSSYNSGNAGYSKGYSSSYSYSSGYGSSYKSFNHLSVDEKIKKAMEMLNRKCKNSKNPYMEKCSQMVYDQSGTINDKVLAEYEYVLPPVEEYARRACGEKQAQNHINLWKECTDFYELTETQLLYRKKKILGEKTKHPNPDEIRYKEFYAQNKPK